MTREERISVFEDTMKRIESDEELKNIVLRSIREQTIYYEGTVEPYPPVVGRPKIIVSPLRSLEAAAQYIGKPTMVLNFASATTPGGGVTSGASAQEESICRASTLYPCINSRYTRLAYYDFHRQYPNPLHNDDIIYTPVVRVIKDDDYNILDYPFDISVITCAAPNLREKPSNKYNLGDGKKVEISKEDLLKLHEQRARQILNVASIYRPYALIVGAFGCGAFQNPPEIVAQAWKNVLASITLPIIFVEFAIYCPGEDKRNYNVFKQVLLDNHE